MRLLLSALLFFYSTITQAQSPNRLLIQVGKLYDSQQKIFLNNQKIFIENGIIKEIGPNIKKAAGVKFIDLSQCTATPGLIDMHTHLLIHQKQSDDGMIIASKVPASERIKQGLAFAKENLEVGLTTVRDIGNSGQYLDVALKKELAKGKALGPTMYVSGPILSPPGGQFGKMAPADSFVINQEYRVIKGADDARLAVLEHIKHGVDVIKVCMNTDNRMLTLDEISAIVKTAHENNIPVTAHATTDKSARAAVLAGVNGIEHGYDLSDNTLILMAQRGTYLVPTDVTKEQAKILVEGIGMRGKEAEDYAKGFLDGVHDRLRRAVGKGVTILSGSDFYNDIKGLPRGKGAVGVILSYHEAGIPVNEVLQYATYNAAKALGASDSIGTIKKGMKADIVFFNGDLEKDFGTALFDVQMVLKDGIPVYPKRKTETNK
ncbi:amidohydrolase family protein [Emticicia sp. C21]|uniref:amidohydrolase family protein n=1 Tax=Emticicia sp. C21 TaxID=2302915 RepID=UPI000E34B09A|nr:amidohydrolase family protein [Emticicia sp. C21]RFS16219.1 amidohydrolase family protein [Emticicia sp. C21]